MTDKRPVEELVAQAVNHDGARTHDDIMRWLEQYGYEFDHDRIGAAARNLAATGQIRFSRKTMTYSFYEPIEGEA